MDIKLIKEQKVSEKAVKKKTISHHICLPHSLKFSFVQLQSTAEFIWTFEVINLSITHIVVSCCQPIVTRPPLMVVLDEERV